jgi:hypothetical protein
MLTETVAKWFFKFFVLILVGINAALTFSFGYTYLGAAFGTGVAADYGGAVYALIIFDVAYLVWFLVFSRDAESVGQRAAAGLLAGVSLLGSIIATLNQLALNSFGLVDLSGYHETIGLLALIAMLAITAGHIIGMAAYALMAPGEWQLQTAINEAAEDASENGRVRQQVREKAKSIRESVTNQALSQLEARVQVDTDLLVHHMADRMRRQLLSEFGFTADVRPVGGDAPALRAGDEAKPKPAPQPGTRPVRIEPEPQPPRPELGPQRPQREQIGPIEEGPMRPTQRPAQNGRP